MSGVAASLEWRLLLRLAAKSPGDDAGRSALNLPAQGVDWSALLHLARAHDVSPLLGRHLVESPIAGVPEEVRAALRSGVEVWGASSMGALRAAECWPIGMQGVGWVYEQYRSGAIQADDEVALIFDASTGAARTTPLVNVRWSAQQATAAGVLSAADAEELLACAVTLRYEQRSYRCLQRLAPARLQAACAALLSWVAAHPEQADRKGLDARELLCTLAAAAEAP